MRLALSFFLTAAVAFSGFSQADHVGSGRAILFDGIDDYIDLGNIYDDVALPITISAWVFIEPDASVKQYPIFTSQDNLLTYNGFTFVTSTLPHIGFTIGDGRGGNSGVYRRSRAGYYDAMGQWVYLTAVAKSGQDINTYINGQILNGEYQGSSPYPMNSMSPSEVAKIGFYFSNNLTYWFKGMMDELRIWNRALTIDEIRESMCHRLKGNEPGLIGYWNFDETSGSILSDLSPNRHDGVLKGDPRRVFSGAPVGNGSVFLYTGSWPGKSLVMDEVTVSGISSEAYGIHIYRVDAMPSQTGGLDHGAVQQPYYGVFVADDGQFNTFDLAVSERHVCGFRERHDNSQPAWEISRSFTAIPRRIEIISSNDDAALSGFLGDDETLCEMTSRTLTVPPMLSGETFQFTWHNGSHERSVTVDDFGTYWLRVDSPCGTRTDSVTFAAKRAEKVELYNFISPDNRDLSNQYFQLDDKLSGSHLIVFNRWGKPVFESKNYQNDWDGNGLPSSVYYYMIRHACGPLKGSLTILR